MSIAYTYNGTLVSPEVPNKKDDSDKNINGILEPKQVAKLKHETAKLYNKLYSCHRYSLMKGLESRIFTCNNNFSNELNKLFNSMGKSNK